MVGEPILPANRGNPANQWRRIGHVMDRIKAILKEAEEKLISELGLIQAIEIQNASRYEYLVDLSRLEAIIAELAQKLSKAEQVMVDAALGAYAEGTSQASVNLSGLTDDYARPLTGLLSSEPYLRRSSLAGARVMEEMKGFSAQQVKDLSRVLMEGIQSGLNPRTVSKSIIEQFSAAKSRAERIARTEINGALRRGRLDEEQDAQEKLGIKTGMLWASALKPTTRPSHARRHGKVYTIDEVRDFYSRDGNGINCMCAQTSVLLDDDGNPTSRRAIDRMSARREKYLRENPSEE